MSANLFGERFYGLRTPAWHNMGIVSSREETAKEVFQRFNNYHIEKRVKSIFLNGEHTEIDEFALVRSPVPDDNMERVFGSCTSQYNILQPLDIVEIYDANVKQPVETLGMLGKGEKLFITWTLPEIKVIEDIVKTYGFVAVGYDAKFGATLSLITTRVVCENTWNMAIRESESESAKASGRGKVWTGRHNSSNLARDLGIWLEHVNDRAMGTLTGLQEQFVQMARAPMKDTDELVNLLFKIYPDPKPMPEDYPAKLKDEKMAKIEGEKLSASNDRVNVVELFMGAGTAIDATAWGLFNSVTEYENWGRTTRRSPDNSILLGDRSRQMDMAYAVISNHIANK